MADLPFIDTHVHFYDLENPKLRYDLLKPGAQHEIIEDIRAIKALRYWADDWLAETRFSNVVKSIHVQCAGGSPIQSRRRAGSRPSPTGSATHTASWPRCIWPSPTPSR